MRISPRTIRLGVGLAFVLGYALPLFAPPPTPFADVTLVRHDLLTRLFPEVPAWWILSRLAALVLGVGLVASAVPAAPIVVAAATTSAPHGTATGRWLALAAAVAHVACFPWIGVLSPWGQTLYLVWLGVPALLLAATGARRRIDTGVPRGVWLALGAVVGGWITLRLAASAHSPRLADIVDMWRTFSGLGRLVTSGGNFLVDGIDPQLPGVNSTPIFFQGFSLLQILHRPLTLGWVQAANTLWIALAALTTGALAARVVAPWASVVAAATLLGSSMLLLFQMEPGVGFLGSLSLATVGWLCVRFVASASPAGLALFGGVAGLVTTYPAVAPATGLAVLFVSWRLWTGPRVPGIVVLTAALSGLAALLPSVPSPAEFQKMVALYVTLDGHATTLQATILGQIPSNRGAAAGWRGGHTGPFDIPVAALLSPVATSRMALRLWGDTVFDPLGSAWAAIGIAICVRHVRRQRAGLALLVVLLATLATGFASSTDKPSLYRVFASPVPVGLLAAVGFTGVARALNRAPSASHALFAAAAIVGSGIVLFDHVNPRILERSAPGLALEALTPDDLGHAAIVTDPRENANWLYLDVIAQHVPARPLAVVPSAALDEAVTGGASVLFWSPAAEQTAGLEASFCRRWPQATRYIVRDPSRRSWVHALALGSPSWTPALPPSRWQAQACSALPAP